MAEVFKLPVNPEKLEVRRAGNNKSFYLANLGEVTITDQPKAATVVIESFLPELNSSFALAGGETKYRPKQCVEMLESWRNSLKPMRLTVTGNAKSLSLACTIEDFVYWEVAGSGGDIYFRLELKEYRFFASKQVGSGGSQSVSSVSASSGSAKSIGERANSNTGGSTYTVKSGDSLWSICQRQLGDGSKYKSIAKLNGIANPNMIRVGQVIRLQ